MAEEPTLIDAQPVPYLTVAVGGKVVETVQIRDELTIGRAEDNALTLADAKASRHHVHVQLQGESHVLTDLGSANGTWLGGIRLNTPHTLRHGEQFTIGDTTLTYHVPGQGSEDTFPKHPIVSRERAGPPRRSAGTGRRPGAMSRAAVIGLIVGGVIIVLALIVGGLYLLKPDLLADLGLVREPGSTEGMQSPEATEPPTPVAGEHEATTVPPGVSPTPETETPTTLPVPVGTALTTEEFDGMLDQARSKTLVSKFEEAIEIYQGLAQQEPADARPEIGWAWALIFDLEAGEAVTHAERAVDLNPDSAEAAAVLARALIETGDSIGALEEAQRALALAPVSAEAHTVLADAYMVNGQYLDAVDEADLALVQDITHAGAHRIRAWLYYTVDNDLAMAASEFQKAAGLQPQLWLRRHELGRLLLAAGNYNLAIIAFQDALAIRPKAVTYAAIGESYFGEGDYDQARVALRQALALGAEDADTYGLLAATLAHQDRCDDALSYTAQALSKDPGQVLALEAQDICEGSRPGAGLTPGETPSATEATPELTSTPPTPATLSGRIAFPVWNGLSGKYDTYIAQARDGSGRSLVATEMHQPALSPDGEWLALNGERPDHVNLFIVRADGSSLQEITENAEDGQPYWAPGGHRLVLASNRHGDKQFRIYILDDIPWAGGKVTGRALNYGPDDIRGDMPAWTDANQIVYRGCKLDSPANECWGYGLFIMSAQPGVQTPRELTSEPGDSAPATYGNRIAFLSDRDGDWELYALDTSGSNLQQLTDNSVQDGLPTWSPDGKAIAFVSNQGGGWAVWAINPDGSNRRKLFGIGGNGLSSDWVHERISWGP
jgi:tetratricopeptide (TPR) repeat protein/pSer/pThr/pTyr-binding forkhead associated (FHA) protein